MIFPVLGAKIKVVSSFTVTNDFMNPSRGEVLRVAAGTPQSALSEGVAVRSSCFLQLLLLFIYLFFWSLLLFDTFIRQRKEFLSISKQTVAACACFVNYLSRENPACASGLPRACPRLSPVSLTLSHSTRNRLFNCAV